MRKLATIRRIDELVLIEGADAIVMVKIDGWECVALKEEFSVGDLCVYFEIDSLIPMSPAVEHLRNRAFKKMGDKEGIRIKTIRLRGQLSQGLALPLSKFGIQAALGDDVSDVLGVVKYELPIPSELAGQVRGDFPRFIPKTDEERCQNIVRKIFEENADARYEVSMKMDGTSFTGFHVDGEQGVCGRNWEQVISADNPNKLVRTYMDSKLGAILHELSLNYAIQGELMGPGIQQNREGLEAHRLFIFKMYHISECRYLTPKERHDVLANLYAAGLDRKMVEHVPVLSMGVTLAELGITNIKELLAFAEGPSLNHSVREGLVFKRVDGGFSFKVISNAFLLKEKD
jgi:RNA ligase (TIGR02306 family)